MAAKRRPRKPLRSELSDGVRRKRNEKPFKTVAPTLATRPLQAIVEAVEEVVDEVVTAEVDTAPEEPTEEPQEVIVESEPEEEAPSEEDELRAKAKEMGVSHWWTKKVDTLRSEIKELESETGE